MLLLSTDYHWWENIPEDINFSPSTSFSRSSSRSDKAGNKVKAGLNVKKDEPFSLHDVEKLSSSVRNPSLADFLDFPDNSKLLKAAENSVKTQQEYNPENFQLSIAVEEWSSPEAHAIDEKENAAVTIQRYYRGYKTRRQEGHSAVQKVLEKQRELREQRKKVWKSFTTCSFRQLPLTQK